MADNFNTLDLAISQAVLDSVGAGGNDAGKDLLPLGNFEVWQDGTSFTGVSNGDYTADGIKYASAGTAAVVDAARSTTVPNSMSDYSHELTVTTADASVDAGDRVGLLCPIEGSRIANTAFGTADASDLTLSFYVRSSVAGTYCVAFQNGASNRTYVAEYSVNSINTYEKKTVTISGDVAGTWVTDKTLGLQVFFTLAAGSTHQTTAGAWAAETKYGTSNQTNWAATVSNTFYLSQIQLETGSNASAYRPAFLGDAINFAQRYYYKTYNLDVVPGTNPTNVGEIGFRQSGPNIVASLDFPRMRSTPAATLYSPNTGSTGFAYDYNGATDVVASIQALGETGIVVVLNGTDQNHVAVHLTVDTRL